MFGSMLILLAMTGQCPPGGACPAPSAPPGVARQWLRTTSPVDGSPICILGWVEGDRVRFDAREYPQFVPKPAPTPAPAPKPAPGPTATAGPPTGVVAEKLPHINAGAAWYGGNVPVGDGDGPGPGKPPAPGRPEVFVTVIGEKKERNAVRSRLSRDPEFRSLSAEMGDRLAVADYDPSNPMVAGVGLPDGGRPDVVVQDAAGKELARFASDPGPAAIVAEVRKADPSYRPGRRDDAPSALPEWLVLAAGGVAGFSIYLALQRKAARP